MGFLFLKGPSSGILILKGTVPHVSLIFKGTASWDSYSERDRHGGVLFLKGPSSWILFSKGTVPHVILIVKGTVAHDSNCAK
jgi:hypothetical protein